MNFQVVTLFPEEFRVALKMGVIGQSIDKKQIQVQLKNPRDFGKGIHQSVDDRPFGGGDGMLMCLDPLIQSLKSFEAPGHVVFLSPQGGLWNDAKARDFSHRHKTVTLICGRYAGVDQRFIQNFVNEEISIGDFILSGGELAALTLIDSISRFIPGVLGHPLSAHQDSFSGEGLLECPQWTRPQNHSVGAVPAFVMSGHHSQISLLRKAISVVRTAVLRPDIHQDIKSLQQAVRDLKGLSESDLEMVGLSQSHLNRILELI